MSSYLGTENISHELFLSITKLSFIPTTFLIFFLFLFTGLKLRLMSHFPHVPAEVKLNFEPTHLLDQLADDIDPLLFELLCDHLDMFPLGNLKVPHLYLHLSSLDVDVVVLGRVSPLSEVVPLYQIEAVSLELIVVLKVSLVTAVLDPLVEKKSSLGLVELVGVQVLCNVRVEFKEVGRASNMVLHPQGVASGAYFLEIITECSFFS